MRDYPKLYLDATGLASGAHFCRLQFHALDSAIGQGSMSGAGGLTQTKRMVFLEQNGGIMKKSLLWVLMMVLVPQTHLRAQSPVIQAIIDSVRIDSFIFVVKELSGEVPTTINGIPQTILSRHRDQPGNALAEGYIKQKLESYGLATTYRPTARPERTSWQCRSVRYFRTGSSFSAHTMTTCQKDQLPRGQMPMELPLPSFLKRPESSLAILPPSRSSTPYGMKKKHSHI